LILNINPGVTRERAVDLIARFRFAANLAGAISRLAPSCENSPSAGL